MFGDVFNIPSANGNKLTIYTYSGGQTIKVGPLETRDSSDNFHRFITLVNHGSWITVVAVQNNLNRYGLPCIGSNKLN